MEAVGAGGAGGGGGGGGAAFFPQAPSVSRAPSVTTSRDHLILCCFTLFPPATLEAYLQDQTKRIYYFQLQLGWVLRPVKVSCWTFVPSASIVQISSLPDRLD